jgi:hypothetical protein
LVVNTTAAAVDAALDGFGIACILSYQAEPHIAAGKLQTVLVEYESPPAPIHIVHPQGRHLPAKVRLFSTTPPERFAPNSGEDNLIAAAVARREVVGRMTIARPRTSSPCSTASRSATTS